MLVLFISLVEVVVVVVVLLFIYIVSHHYYYHHSYKHTHIHIQTYIHHSHTHTHTFIPFPTHTHLVPKLQFISCHHVNIVVNSQDTLCLDLFIRIESVTQFILPRLNHLERNADLGPKGGCGRRKRGEVMQGRLWEKKTG